MSPSNVGLVSGVVASSLVLGFLGYRKYREVEARVEHIKDAVEGDAAAQSDLARLAADTRARIEAVAEARADELASEIAEKRIKDRFGLTPERISSIDRLASMF